MFFDAHTHAFHPKIAAKATVKLEEHYKIKLTGTGVLDDLLARAKKAGLDKVVVLCAATAAAQVVPANNFAIELGKTPEVIPFGTIHPDYEDWKGQMDVLRAAGIRGLKLHPDFQGFRMDDPRLLPIIEETQDDFVYMWHVGDVLPPKENPSCPYKLAALMDMFPRARFIAAHFGGYQHWDYAMEALVGRNVWFDTSSALEFMTDAQLKGVLDKHPREKILFGSDYPLYDPSEEYKVLQSRTGYSDAIMEELLSNAGMLLGITE